MSESSILDIYLQYIIEPLHVPYAKSIHVP